MDRSALIEELRWYWNDQEAAMGVCSSHGVAVNREAGLSSAIVESATPFEEGMCWTNGERDVARDVRRALTALSPDQVQVLYAAFGPRVPAARVDVLDEETARLAPNTRCVSEARQAIANRLAEARIAAVDEAERRSSGGARVSGVAKRAPLDTAALERIAASHRRAAWREVGVVDALAGLLGPRLVREEGESRAAFEGRRARVQDAIRETALALRTEVAALLSDALTAYATARAPGSR